MDKFELQKLRDLPIEGVAERLGLSVSRHKCLCPFHDDHHASLSFKVQEYLAMLCVRSVRGNDRLGDEIPEHEFYRGVQMAGR